MKRNSLLLLIMLCSCMASAQMTTRVVRDSLFIPWELVYGADDHIWFTQKNGYICRLNPGSGHIDTLLHETNTVVNNEGGMLGMALHPSFATNPYVYVAYEYNQSGYKERIVRYTYGSNTLSAPMILLDNITGASIHNGCRLAIVGDKLFITTGDAAATANSQNIQSLNGKTLRINLDGSIPADNPFPNNPVWSWGHRNAQGMVYANGRLYQSEHGPSSDDEINVVQKARNYGWPTVTGYCNTPTEIVFCNDSNVVEPLQTWTPTIAASGMDYYNHPMFPALQNSLLMTTLKDQKLYQLKLNAGFDSVVSATPIAGISFGRLRAICVAPSGKIYISTSMSNASGSGAKVDKIIELFDPSVNDVPQIADAPEISLYPNPSQQYAIVKMSRTSLNESYAVRVFDATGRMVQQHAARGGSYQMMVGNLAAGIYHVEVRNAAGQVWRVKMMKQ